MKRNTTPLLKTVWRAALGISSELLLVYFFIFMGLLTCVIWWAALK